MQQTIFTHSKQDKYEGKRIMCRKKLQSMDHGRLVPSYLGGRDRRVVARRQAKSL
jgi:hypothetical protein